MYNLALISGMLNKKHRNGPLLILEKEPFRKNNISTGKKHFNLKGKSK